MNVELYGYSVMTCFLGMGVVFTFLGFLCVFMVFLKKVIDGPKLGKKSDGASAKTEKPSAAVPASSKDDNTWIIAAVAAYLEEESAPVSAMAWMPSASEKQESWVTVPRIQKRLARA